MLSAAAVLVCAFDLLARPAASFAPIVLLDTRPPDVSSTAEAFVRRDPDTIYLLTSTSVFRAAQNGSREALLKVASILVHEQWHIVNGNDEERAYQAQLMSLYMMGIPYNRPIAADVRRAMFTVIKARKRAETTMAAAR
jgi:hypothetical protein